MQRMKLRAERIPIVMACDEGYAMPLVSMLGSIADLNSRNWSLNVYTLSEGFREEAYEGNDEFVFLLPLQPAGTAVGQFWSRLTENGCRGTSGNRVAPAGN